MIRKKKLLIISGLLSLGILIWNYVGNYRVCDFFIGGSTGNCPFILTRIGINLFPVIPLFLLSLITYKMRDEVYRTWVRFVVVWVPLSMFAIFFSPEYADSFGIALYPITKSSIAFVSSILFIIISLILIIWKWFSLRRSAKP